MKWFLLVLPLALASCTTAYLVDASPHSIARTTVRVAVSEGSDGDATCNRSIKSELRKRGFTLVESSTAPANTTVRFADEWKWDMLMYLWALDVYFTDTATGAVKGSAHFKTTGFHAFPRQEVVVKKLFEAMDAKQAFKN